MEKINLPAPIHIMYITVESFPLGIKEAFDKLYDQYGTERSYYGLSHMDQNRKIVYKAAVAGTAAEAATQGYGTYTIPAGDYLAETIVNWMSKTDSIKDVFMQLMQDPGFDHITPCIEWYKSDDELQCFVKLK